MVFASPLFLFAFLPLVLALYYLTPSRARNFVLLCASLLFYAWGEHEWVVVMLASTAVNWAGAILVDNMKGKRGERWVLGSLVALNLLALGCFKYADFVVDNVNVLLVAAGLSALARPELHLPLGISFFTFHAISYVVDVHRGESRALRNPLDTALYIALFPQLVAGPIIRYHYIEEQLKRRRPTLADMTYGIQRFVAGLAKKVLIANVVAANADAIFALPPERLTLGVAWCGILAYALQIYFDFSGYSDMAIGLASMFGFRFPENFNYPYVARSLTDFWRRWHISLSSWFRDYLYIPLGGNRVGKARTYVNLVVVFLLCGLWHGASWVFVTWGALHGAFLVLERSSFGVLVGRAPRLVQHGYALLVIAVGWVFFRASDMTQALSYLGAMAGGAGLTSTSHPLSLYVTPAFVTASVLGILFSTPIVPGVRALLESRAVRVSPALGYSFSIGATVLLFTVSAAYLATRTYNPFIYFRF